MYSKLAIAAALGMSLSAFAGGAVVAPPVNPCAANSMALSNGNSIMIKDPSIRLMNNHVWMGGLLNLDAYWSSKTNYTTIPQFSRIDGAGGSSSTIYINNANLLFGADYGWAHAHMNIGYFNRPTLSSSNSITNTNSFTLDEAYATFANFSQSPFYMRVGKNYGIYGDYHPYKLVPDLTQLMTQIQGTGVEAGVIMCNGFFAKANFFGDNSNPTYFEGSVKDNRRRIDDWSLKIGYASTLRAVHFMVNAGYLNDVRGLSYLDSNDFQASTDDVIPQLAGTFQIPKSSGFAAHLGLTYNAFDLNAKFARFNKEVNVLNTTVANSLTLNKPYAADVDLGYSFNGWGRPFRVSAGYQWTRKASLLLLPKSRWTVGLGAAVNKYLSAQLAYYHDKGYNNYVSSNATTGTVKSTNTILGRISAAI